MGAINSIKKLKTAVGSMNNNKNKLNNEIIYNFNFNPNAC